MKIDKSGVTVLYKIRNKQTGQFAKAGTSNDRWSKEGKTFTSQTLKLHMKQFNPSRPDYPYKDEVAEIVQYILREEDTRVFSPSQF